MDKVRYLINEICTMCGEPSPFLNVREEFSITVSHPPSVGDVRSFFMKVFQGKYDIGELGLKYFLLGFVETVQVCNYCNFLYLQLIIISSRNSQKLHSQICRQ